MEKADVGRAHNLSYPRDMVGASVCLTAGTWEPGKPWHVVDYAQVIGHGEQDFQCAVDNLFAWRAHKAVGVRVVGKPQQGSTVQLHFGPTVSPCRIISASRTEGEDGTRQAVLVYGTEYGHIECGEEAFIIEMNLEGEVIGRCVAFSQHSWWLARLFSGPAGVVQRWATRRYVRGMKPRFGKYGSGRLK